MDRIVLAGAVAVMAIAGCSGDAAVGAASPESDSNETVTPVRVALAEAAEVSLPIEGIGTLGAKEEIALSFNVGGIVREIAVDAGSRVVAGQILASLDMSVVDAAMTQAQAAMDKAERDLARAQQLYADSVVALAQLEDATTAAEIARAGLESASFNRRFAEIVAPSDGVILRRTLEPGELASPGAPVVVLASRERGVVLRVGLADRDVVRVRRGDSARIRFDAYPEVAFTGTVAEIGASAQPGTGTFLVEIAVANAEGLFSGLVGHATIAPRDVRAATVVPLGALLEADQGAGTIFVLGDGGRVERRLVSLGPLLPDRVEVTSGVAPGEVVVTEGGAYLRDGAMVEVTP